MNTEEKLNKTLEALLRAANALREVANCTDGGVRQFAKEWEQRTRRKMKELGAPEFMLTELDKD